MPPDYQAVDKAPRTCEQWAAFQKSARNALIALKFPVPRMPTKADLEYSLTWTVRMLLLHRMWEENVQRLRIGKVSLNTFVHMNPDVGDWLRKVARSAGCATVQSLMKACGHQGAEPELLSASACFSSDQSLGVVDWNNFNVEEWERAMQKYRREHKIWPIPALTHQLVSSKGS